MSDSIYAPPEAEVAAPADDSEPRYYVVGLTKFLLLSILTFGLYFVYWFYRNWDQVRKSDGDDGWPIARAFFYIFFTHSLLSDVDIHLRQKSPEYRWSPNAIATVFVLLTLVHRLADRLLPVELLTTPVLLMDIALFFVLAALLAPAQKAINNACDDPKGTTNSDFTALNLVWMALGFLWWLVVLTGVLSAVAPGAF